MGIISSSWCTVLQHLSDTYSGFVGPVTSTSAMSSLQGHQRAELYRRGNHDQNQDWNNKRKRDAATYGFLVRREKQPPQNKATK